MTCPSLVVFQEKHLLSLTLALGTISWAGQPTDEIVPSQHLSTRCVSRQSSCGWTTEARTSAATRDAAPANRS